MCYFRLPDPTPPSLAELRQSASFPIFFPTFVPAGLTPEPPVGGEQPGENVEIQYHTADGAVALDVVNGAPDCCLGSTRLRSEDTKLPDGTSARLIRERTKQYGGMTLWWQRDGTSVVISGPNLTQDDLVKSVLTLVEMPKAMIGQGSSSDPQASQETIGGYDVTIIRRGENCISLEWQVGELALTLSNPYDPPGHPRYPCDQLWRIVESLR